MGRKAKRWIGYGMILGLLVSITGCLPTRSSVDDYLGRPIGFSIDELTEGLDAIDKRHNDPRYLEKYKNMAAKYPDKLYKETRQNDGTYIFEVTNIIRKGCVVRYSADKDRILRSYEKGRHCHY